MNTVNLYREEILEHYQEPHNFGRLTDFDVRSREINPLCGDDIEMFVKFKNGVIGDVRFEGRGCAICMAGASMLTDFTKGKTKKELTKFSENDMLSLLGIEVSETRRKCALLALAVLKDCLYV